MTLEDLIKEFQTIPFLFVGSGLSRRYYHLPNWTDLLKQMVKLFNNDSLAYRLHENNASFKNNEYEIDSLSTMFIDKTFNKEYLSVIQSKNVLFINLLVFISLNCIKNYNRGG